MIVQHGVAIIGRGMLTGVHDGQQPVAGIYQLATGFQDVVDPGSRHVSDPSGTVASYRDRPGAQFGAAKSSVEDVME